MTKPIKKDNSWIAVVGIRDENRCDRTHYGCIEYITQNNICITHDKKQLVLSMKNISEIIIVRI